jgi:hypothetical protein
VSVPAIQAAGVSGPTLQAGNVVTVKASGIWCMGGDTECGGADGIRFADVVKETDMVLASSKMGTLLGQFGSDTPFPLGSSATFTAQTSGTLKLLFNDRRCCYGDNTRSLTVQIWINPVLAHRISPPEEAAIAHRTESQWIRATVHAATSANRSECQLWNLLPGTAAAFATHGPRPA